MKIKREALIYDIANMAYVIADTGDDGRHSLHRVRDICESGNIDRVSRMLGLAYSQLLSVLLPVLTSPKFDPHRDLSVGVHDYEFRLNLKGHHKYALTKERQLKIKEFSHEYMVCMVLADWLGVTMPEAADVWKYRAAGVLEALASLVSEIVQESCGSFRRRISPF